MRISLKHPKRFQEIHWRTISLKDFLWVCINIMAVLHPEMETNPLWAGHWNMVFHLVHSIQVIFEFR